MGSGETTVDTALNRNGRVLIVGPSWVGDMVMAQSLFKTVKAEHPAAHIDVLAPEWTRPLTARMPEVADAISLPLGHGELRLSDRYRLGRSLAAKRYTHSIILPNSLKSALIPYFAGIPRRTGYRGEMRWGLLNDMRRLDRARAPMTVQRFVALARDSDQPVHTDFPVPRLEVPKGGLEYALGKLALQRPKGRVMALCPGAEYGPAKRWPAEHFVDIAKRKLDQGWAVWLYGSRKDAPVSSEIDRLTGNRCVDLAGRTKLDEAIDLMSIADVVVTNDSGLMHVAAALGRKIVALYGSSNASHTPPISDKAKVLSLGLSCSPCYKRECPLGHLKCLRDLSPGQVLAAVDELCP
ncbi:MAG: lipopolysaccharide heptosyltransferase II [Gammaproteobacteria bacterium]|nr:lipopolysaccharide heptosyltransferase II [Gammaproteobacteria bacterium]